jgi:SAM-dependent methyltransferase
MTINNFEMIWRLILIIILVPLVATAWWAFFVGGPWAPSRKKDFPRILKILAPKENDLIYELGCGDGRFCVALAKNCDIRVVGFEVSLLPYLIAKLRVWLSCFGNKVKIKYKNFYTQDLSTADVIFCYLTPWGLRKLKPKLERELRPGAKVVCYSYAIDGWQPALKDKPQKESVPIYLYIKNF